MTKWTNEIETELILFLKDWLKQQNKTQKDLRASLNASSERMNSLIDILKRDYSQGGLPKLAERLCVIEESWSSIQDGHQELVDTLEPFDQLDLLLEELNEDCRE